MSRIGHTAAVKETARARAAAAAAINQLTTKFDQALESAKQTRDEMRTWSTRGLQWAWQSHISPFLDSTHFFIPGMIDALDGETSNTFWSQHVDVWNRARDGDASEFGAGYQVLGSVFYDQIGVGMIWSGIAGEHYITGQEMSNTQALMSLAMGSVQLIGTVIGGAQALHAMRGPCGGFIIRRCFTENHEIVTGVADTGTITHADAAWWSSPALYWTIGGATLIVGVGGAPIIAKRRKKKERAQMEREIDDIFGGENIDDIVVRMSVDNIADEISENETRYVSEDESGHGTYEAFEYSQHSGFDINSLCDELFSEKGNAAHEYSDSQTQRRFEGAQNAVIDAPRQTTAEHRRKVDVIYRRASPHRAKTKPARISPRSTFSRYWIAIWSIIAAAFFATGLVFYNNSNDSKTPAQPTRYITKPIKEICVGDMVLARDEFGREIGLRRVNEVYSRTSDHLRILVFEATDGSRQTIETTDEHPFWAIDKGEFIDAKDLRISTFVAGPRGENQRLVSSHREDHPSGISVFNFQVDGFHTYFVRSFDIDGAPILVHNADYTPDDLPDRMSTPQNWKKGDVYDGEVGTSAGPVQYTIEVTDILDETVEVNVAVYPRVEGSIPKQALRHRMIQGLSELRQMATDRGFHYLRIKSFRDLKSSSAYPGHAIDVTIDLLKKAKKPSTG